MLVPRNVAKVCEERWTTLLEKYEKYKKGYLTMHETLIDQLDEYLNINSDIIAIFPLIGGRING
ncbi:hypothetical protein NQ317_010262 [Molorchus minor]|uniref:Uncharacterized protein n=1 Tax=Molorchus minor TaxID=1323400 RepID=A0ABQ9JDP1_9CUCU|nr:hypothetical protein NQ317_010262 [Molorchus minor]